MFIGLLYTAMQLYATETYLGDEVLVEIGTAALNLLHINVSMSRMCGIAMSALKFDSTNVNSECQRRF